MADRLKPSELVAEVKRLQEQVDGLTDGLERIVARLDGLEGRLARVETADGER